MGAITLSGLHRLVRRAGMVVIAILIFAAPISGESAGETDLCFTCGKDLIAGAWEYPQGIVCVDCHENEPKCSICGLPAAGERILTKDGRTICRREMNEVVVRLPEVNAIFETTWKELTWITEDRLKLKTPRVKVQLFEVDHWNSEENVRDGIDYRTTGLAETMTDGKRFQHKVSILSHQMPDEVRAVTAHEYAHLWINENTSFGRKLEGDTEEAICELVAWKYMNLKRDEGQKDAIQKNPYTKGKIREVIDLEIRYGFNNILDWVVTGQESQLNEAVLREFINPSLSLSLLASAKPATKKTFDQLELKGIMYSKRNPMAMINDKTLSPGESVTVEVAGKPETVRCLEIHPDRVVLLLEETSEKIVLSSAE